MNTNPLRYTMAQASAVSAGAVSAVESYLRQRPDTLRVRNVEDGPAYQAQDVDLLWIVRLADGRADELKVEVKGDRWGHRTGNFFFETVSNRARGTPGCFLYTAADYLFYVFVRSRLLYILPMPATRDWFLPRQERFAERATSTPVGGEAYVTVGRLVPVTEVLAGVAGVETAKLPVIAEVS